MKFECFLSCSCCLIGVLSDFCGWRFFLFFFKLLSKHAKFGRYSIDFKKCLDVSCCQPFIDVAFAKMLSPFNGFIPPIALDVCGHYTKVGSLLSFPPANMHSFKYSDMFLPSTSHRDHAEGVCSDCSQYFPVKKLRAWHRKLCNY